MPEHIWIDHDPAWHGTCTRLENGPDPVAAFDALVGCLRDNALKLAAHSSIYERSSGTRDLRTMLDFTSGPRREQYPGLQVQPGDRYQVGRGE